VIANLTLWFGLHVLFLRFVEVGPPWARLSLPDPASFDPAALGLSLVAAVLLFSLRQGVLAVLAACLSLGVGLHFSGLI
jgi:chromate transporter